MQNPDKVVINIKGNFTKNNRQINMPILEYVMIYRYDTTLKPVFFFIT